MNSKNSLIDRADTTLLIEQFPLLATSPNGITNLRELILQLAVRGKLGTQDASDEPARVLFDKIKSINQQLVKQDRIRNERPLKEISDSDVPYKIPESWIWTRLGNIGQIVGGGTPRTSNSDYYVKDGIPWLTPADLYRLKERFVKRGRRDISEIGLSESSAQLLPKGTVLFSSRAPIGYVAIASNSLATNQGFKSCIPFIMEMSEYIYYFLKAAAIEIDAKASGTTFKEISGQEMKQILIPLPPLAEQQRIVQKVDCLMALCDTLEFQQRKEHESRVLHGTAALTVLLKAKDSEELEKIWKHLTGNFDGLFDCLENILTLRQTILQLAVRGQLAEQNIDDESVSDVQEIFDNTPHSLPENLTSPEEG
ncbi:MAG TPA: restriction endonuclease subunit S [Methanoregulaceae archaeon]|nr:MAG: restriction endonuclease subunit S [Methanolinea sp.]HON82399.1 restriction endonuclease subunit S [Methanoregulaceae archaeon]HPD11265.1 restriction endonuclease subunit S [Methanoregulaceae archaeon]